MGLTKQDVDDIYNGWKSNMAAVFDAVIEHNGLPWQSLGRL